jgi:uncharacterized protein YecE (DUF72 family)
MRRIVSAVLKMRKPSKSKLYIGTSNVVLPGPKKDFPKEHRGRTRLGYYALLFHTVELNSTFYKLPRSTTIEKWCHEVPDHFKFTTKLWRQITHQKKLQYHDRDLIHFMDVMNSFGTKKGCLLVQFPATITFDLQAAVAALLSKVADLNHEPKWQIAVEFRHQSWYAQQETYSMLKHARMTIVYQDMPKSQTPLTISTSNVVYIRFHGPTGTYRDSYAHAFLKDYAKRINQWRKQGKEVYAYFNNTMGAAFANAQTLIKDVDPTDF